MGGRTRAELRTCMTACKATCSTFLQLICPLHFLHKTHYVPVAMRITVTFPKTQINVDLPAKNSTKFKIVISKSLICSFFFFFHQTL